MIVHCPQCQKRLKVPDTMMGRRVGCNKCLAEIDVPREAPSASVAAVPPPVPAPTSASGTANEPPATTRRRSSDVPLVGEDLADRKAWIDRFAAAGLALLIQSVLIVIFSVVSGGKNVVGDEAGTQVALGELDNESLTDTDDGKLEEASAAAGAEAANELSSNIEVAITPSTSDSVEGIELSLSPSGGAGSGGGGSGGGDGFGFGKGSGFGGEANFLGVPARGHRFCIVADNSGSMNGPPLEYLKMEIIKTLNAARGSAKFYIVFFNSNAMPQPVKRWTSGKNDVDNLAAWVRNVRAGGGTHPFSGFQAAFEIDPPPDVIYFMTDGGFNPAEVQQIKMLNQRLKKPATIHGIAFGRGAASDLIKQIAADGKGTFRAVNGP